MNGNKIPKSDFCCYERSFFFFFSLISCFIHIILSLQGEFVCVCVCTMLGAHHLHKKRKQKYVSISPLFTFIIPF
jgi:hypothetical protein